ncbi:hypothetical protein [Propionibacterium sp.]|uniref:hypothetical protein n=1 Tax=Propionibacterium sp. TaxID=1977903 RepID=UPI0039E9969E
MGNITDPVIQGIRFVEGFCLAQSGLDLDPASTQHPDFRSVAQGGALLREEACDVGLHE